MTLRFDGATIHVASVAPQANWAYHVELNGPQSVEVKFYNNATGADREFHAAVSGGRINVET